MGTSGPWSMSVSEQEAKTCKAYKPLCDQCKVLRGSKLIDWELVPAGVKPNTEVNKNVKEESASASRRKQSIEKKMQNSAKELLKDKKEALVMEKAGDILGSFGGGNKALGMIGGDEQSSKTKSEGSSKLGSLSKFASNFGFLELKEMNESSGNDCQMKIPRCIRVGESWVDSSFTYLPKMICAVDGQPFLEIPRDVQEVAYRMEAPKNPAAKGAFFTVDFVLKSEWPQTLQEEFFQRSVGNSVTCHTPDDLVFTGYMKGECSLVM